MIGHTITNGGAGIGLVSGPITEFTLGYGFVLAVMAAIGGLIITYGTMWFMAEGKVPALSFLGLVGGTAVIGVANVAPTVFTYTPDERTNALQAAALGLMFGIGAALARWRPRTGPVADGARQRGVRTPVEGEPGPGQGSQDEHSADETTDADEEDEDTPEDPVEQPAAASSTPDIVNRDINPQEDD